MPPRILVVDDEPDMRTLMRTALEDEGYEIVTASSSPEAKGVLATGRFDLAVTDLIMPGESGYSLITHIRATEAIKKLPVIAISCLDAEREVMREGADAYIGKPFTTEELLALVRQWMPGARGEGA